MAHLEAELRAACSADEVDDAETQPQVKDWALRSPLERFIARGNRDHEYLLTENLYRHHAGLAAAVAAQSDARKVSLLRASPTLRAHVACGDLRDRGGEHHLRDAWQYEIAGLLCYGRLFGLERLLLPWRACVERALGNLDRCRAETVRLADAIAAKQTAMLQAFADPSFLEISSVCEREAFIEDRGRYRDRTLVWNACVGPKACPALYRRLRACFDRNQGTTRGCSEAAGDYFACLEDFVYQPYERYFVSADQIPVKQVPHPAVQDRVQGAWPRDYGEATGL